jgi:Chalcone isomerase like
LKFPLEFEREKTLVTRLTRNTKYIPVTLNDASPGPSTLIYMYSMCHSAGGITQSYPSSFTCLLFRQCGRSALIRMSTKFLRLFNYYRSTVRRFASSVYAQPSRRRSLAWPAALAISAGLVSSTPYKIYLDSQANVVEDTIGDHNFYHRQFAVHTNFNLLVDPATSISFPKSMKMPENIKLSSPLTLVGVGVRTVSFLGIRVYSVGFYADLDNSSLEASSIFFCKLHIVNEM